MGAEEQGTLKRLMALRRQLIDPKIMVHAGRIVKTTGDGLLAEFRSVVDAVHCAAEAQRGMLDCEPDLPDERRIRFRIGINLGDVIADGDGINVAARLEALAEPAGSAFLGRCATRSAASCPTRSRTRASRTSRISRFPYGSVRCAPKLLPICRRRACRLRHDVGRPAPARQ